MKACIVAADCAAFSALPTDRPPEMANSRQTMRPDLFQPLTGQENASRLEAKFGHYLDSDDEIETGFTPNKAKVSEHGHDTDVPLKWLNSQTGTSTIIQGNKRVKQKRNRLNQHNRCEQGKRTTEPEKATRKQSAASFSKRLEPSSSSRADVIISCNTQDTDMHVEEISVSHTTVCDDISENHEERPRLTIAPTSDKVSYKLSADDVQPPVIVPATINQYLRDYQRDGIRFLYQHYIAKTGAILGDDMGLGKTIQVISFLAALLGKQGNHVDTLHAIPKFIRQMSDDIPSSPPKQAHKPFLIIGPSAVMYNWLDEFKTWGYFSASKFHGADKETCLDDLKKGKLEIVVTTFETFRDNTTILNQVEWEAVIVDEVHKIKGLKAQITHALRTIKTPCRFGLTGTVLQNNMSELWSLFDWVQPGILGTLEQFETNFIQAIENGQRHDATKRELAQARKQKDAFSDIRKKLMLRRTKALIADQLPSKEDMVVMCRLSELQISVYKAVLSHPDMQLVLCAEDPCDCRSGKARASCCYKKSSSGTKSWALVLTFMHLLLKAANHMALLIPDKNTKEKQANFTRSICNTAFKDCPQFMQQTHTAAFRTLSDPKYCGKMKVLQGLLSAFTANHDKVLVFSYSTRLLDIIEQYVISQGLVYRRIDGKTSSQHRQDIVKRFNSDSSIFLCLISTKAGGLGLNLTGANRVVIFDPNWNPSHDLQAQDRAYRIGQTRDVKVYRLVSAGTIEENIYLRQIYKQQLDEVVIGTANARRYFHGIQGDKGNCGELFGIKNMFSLRTGNSCLTMDILKRNDKIEKGLAGYDITHYVPPNQSRTTDFAENDDEKSDLDDSHLLGSESDEDEEFLRNLFGSESSHDMDLEQEATDECHSEAAMNGSHQIPITLNKVAMESDSDDDQFSLIPNLYNRPHHQAHSTENARSSLLAPGLSSLSSEKNRLSNPDTVSFTGITFSSRTLRHSDVLDKRSESAGTVQRGAVSGISWLFEDSDDEENINKHDNKIGSEANKCFVELKNNKFKPGASATSGPEETERSNCISRSNINPRRNISATKLKAFTERTTSAEMKASTSKEKVSLEQLVLRSSDIIHTHANAKVVGSSRGEDHMTKCAMQDVFELHTNSQAPALQCDPYVQEEVPEQQKKGKAGLKGDDTIIKCSISGSFLLVGQTPASLKRQQWCELCKSLDMDQLTLARTLLKADVKTRLDMLREFYSKKHPQMTDVLKKLFSVKQTDQPPEKHKATETVRMSHRRKKAGSKHTDTSTPRDIPVVSIHGHVRRSHLHPPTLQSRSAARQHRDSTSSELFHRNNTLSAQSEDSVSAFPSENQDYFPDEKSDSFLPKLPAANKKSSNAAKVVTYKSKTRLRNKRQSNPYANKGNYEKSGKLIKARNRYSLVGSLLGIDSSDTPSKTENLVEATDNSLLSDKNKAFDKMDCREHTLPYTVLVTPRTDNAQEASKVKSCANDNKSKQEKLSASNNIAHIMDDVFSSLEKHTENQSSPVEEFPRDSKYKLNGLNNMALNSKHSDPPSHNSRLTSDSLFSEEDSVFDCLLRTSTLKDEDVGFFNRVGRKQNFGEKDAKLACDSKDSGVVIKENKVEADIDDLSWCKFDTHMTSSESEERSESLFL
ncbi:hypothetical protein BsWGS_02697 [Bradybaena similaris]